MQRGRGRSARSGAPRFLKTGRVREDATSVWRRRRYGAMVSLLVLAVLVPITSAQAAPSIGVISNFPTSVTVGQTNLPATFTVFNTSSDPGNLTVTDMRLIPSCSGFDPGCDAPGSTPDPGVFTFSPTGTGEAGTACAGQTFNITQTNPTTGEIRFTPVGENPQLEPSTVGSDLDECQINYTVNVVKAPNHDTIPEEPGNATNQLSSATGTHATGTVVTTMNDEITTIIGGGGPVPVTPTITTVASPGVALGGQVTDTATLAGGNNPTGTITFNLYGPGDALCERTPAFVDTATVAGNGPYVSDPFTPTAPGFYNWVASYSGDANNAAVTGACRDPGELVLVTEGQVPVNPTLTTVASPSVPLGGQVFDTATLAGALNPNGAITFDLYGPNDASCSGPPVYTIFVGVSDNGVFTSPPFTPTAAGTYRWVARFNGDTVNMPAISPCNAPNESVVVTAGPGPGPVQPTITTQVAPPSALVGQSVVDTATLAGGNAPTGTITFNAYGPNDATCTGPAVYTAVVPVNGNGAYAATPAFVATAPGQYRFIATYSGDGLNAAATGACNDPNELHVATVASLPTITVDKAATPSSLPAPTGVFTFTVTITNPSTVPLVITSINDSVYGNLGTRAGINTCDDLIGDTLAAAGNTSCSFQGTFTGAQGATETDVVTVVATDLAGNQATDQGSATVTLTAPVSPEVPSVQVEVTPQPRTLEEPGGAVRYRVTITNTSNPVDITITSIVDSFYGNIAALPEPNTCDSLIGVVLSPGESVTCEFTVLFIGDAGASRTSTVTVTATTPGGLVVTDSAPAVTVTITDAEPEITVSATVNPQSRPEPGGQFTFTVTVTNESGEPVVLATLDDDLLGDLNGRGTCDAGVTIDAGATYTCGFTASFTGEEGDSAVNTITATVVDDEGNTEIDSDSVTIRLTGPLTVTPTPTAGATPTPTATATFATPSPSPPPAVPTVPNPPAPPGDIVRTGTDVLEWVALAVALIVAGLLAGLQQPGTEPASGIAETRSGYPPAP